MRRWRETRASGRRWRDGTRARERVAQEGAWDDLQVSAMSRLARFVSVPRNGFADQTVSISQMIPTVSGKNLAGGHAVATRRRRWWPMRKRAGRSWTWWRRREAAYFKLANAQGADGIEPAGTWCC